MYKKPLSIRYKHTWIKPDGYDTKINIYNCVTKTKVPLITEHKGLIKWYTCGPTVYDSSHVGHACCYVKLDIVQKILKRHFQHNILSVMNVTDIDDKIIKRSSVVKLPPEEISKKYETEFWNDLQKLGIEKPLVVMRVTENMHLIQDFIRHLLDTSYAYKATDDSVYFDVGKDSSYGRLQNVGTIDEVKSGIKRNQMDFALWKAPKDGEPYWESKWGPGRPGWHIECSALAGAIFGSSVDIHAGGIDLRFPHHENEEAQSTAYFSKPQWVNYWMHIGELQMHNFVKMSKSLKNTVSIDTLLENCTSDTFRMACIMSHYRSSMEYSEGLLRTAENVMSKYKYLVNDCNAFLKGELKGTLNPDILLPAIIEAIKEIDEAFRDDFDTPSVVKALNKLTSVTNKMLHSTASSTNVPVQNYYLLAVEEIVSNTLEKCGLSLRTTAENTAQENKVAGVMDILNEFRNSVRNLAIERKEQSLLKLCDKVRSDVSDLGFKINDYGRKSQWIK